MALTLLFVYHYQLAVVSRTKKKKKKKQGFWVVYLQKGSRDAAHKLLLFYRGMKITYDLIYTSSMDAIFNVSTILVETLTCICTNISSSWAPISQSKVPTTQMYASDSEVAPHWTIALSEKRYLTKLSVSKAPQTVVINKKHICMSQIMAPRHSDPISCFEKMHVKNSYSRKHNKDAHLKKHVRAQSYTWYSATSPLRGQFLSGVQQVWIQSLPSPRLVA